MQREESRPRTAHVALAAAAEVRQFRKLGLVTSWGAELQAFAVGFDQVLALL